MTPKRAMTIGGVGLLHVAAISALIAGMNSPVIKDIEHVVQIKILDTPTQPKPVPMPPPPVIVRPTEPTPPQVPVPIIDIAPTTPSVIVATPAQPNTPPVPNSSASGISNTHTTPPYPVEARAAAHQGTVLLQMTVSPQGDVVAANVVTSSGFPELDQSAVNWVVAHWKYKPAIQNGVPVTSQIQAAVRFDLKQASR
jgi:protein TonB